MILDSDYVYGLHENSLPTETIKLSQEIIIYLGIAKQ